MRTCPTLSGPEPAVDRTTLDTKATGPLVGALDFLLLPLQRLDPRGVAVVFPESRSTSTDAGLEFIRMAVASLNGPKRRWHLGSNQGQWLPVGLLGALVGHCEPAIGGPGKRLTCGFTSGRYRT
jgi:hypothetical protein